MGNLHEGVKLNYQQPQPLSQNQMLLVQSQKKSAGIAILLGLLLTGAGQMYAGKVGRGFAFLGAMFVAWLFVFVVVGIPFVIGIFIWSLVDANTQVQQYNAELVFRAQNPGAFPGMLNTGEAIAYNQIAFTQPAAAPPQAQPQPSFAPPRPAPPQPPAPSNPSSAGGTPPPPKAGKPVRHVINFDD